MKAAAIALIGCILASCTSYSTESVMLVDREVYPLSRAEVIAAIKECENAGTQPTLIHARRKVNNQFTPAIVEVTCAPKYKY